MQVKSLWFGGRFVSATGADGEEGRDLLKSANCNVVRLQMYLSYAATLDMIYSAMSSKNQQYLY